jgi:hypothetical protein
MYIQFIIFIILDKTRSQAIRQKAKHLVFDSSIKINEKSFKIATFGFLKIKNQ